MGKCLICRKEKKALFDGICKECLGRGANISLASAINDKDQELIKNIERRASQGEVVRLM